MSNYLTPEERAELDEFWKQNLSSMREEEFRRFVELRQKERGRQGE